MNNPKHYPRLVALLVTASFTLIAACTPQPLVRSGDAGNIEQRAQQEQAAGNLRVAAELYRELADTVSGSARSGYLIEASRLALERNDTAAATAWLREAGADADRDQQQAIVVLLADLDLRADRAANALARLSQLQEPVPVRVMTDRDSVRGRALFVLGRHVEAVRTLVERETWLDNAPDILANQRMIWDGLALLDPQAAPTMTGDALVDGWLALAPIAASDLAANDLRRALLDWRRGFTNHPAASGLLGELLIGVGGVEGYPTQIALLLPISSPQRAVAVAIRDGFFAAHFASRSGAGEAADDETTIRIYDTGILGAQEAYSRAQLEGADFIVGPLLRPEVEQVIGQAGFVPTLALNFSLTDTTFVNSFYQFALWPEDEAEAVAQQAVVSGVQTAVALVPSNPFGLRVLDAFRNEFQALGGNLLAYTTYEPAAQDFSAPIVSLLNIDRSEQRGTRLRANLGAAVAFEPRRRQDVDMIFLYADRRAGRMLAPALRFHFAGDIPTYATSDIYEPGSGGRDNDLNDIYFPDAPWLLSPDRDAAAMRQALEGFWPQRATANIRLYGMGVDAYKLVGSLFSGSTGWPLAGVSGELELDAAGRVHRVLPFGQFRNGRPVALEPVPELEPLRLGAVEPRDDEELAGSR